MIDRTTTALVVDSTADLPEGWPDPNVTVVPLTVFFGDEAYLDWVDLTPEQFYQKLATFPTCPRPLSRRPAAFSSSTTSLRERYE